MSHCFRHTLCRTAASSGVSLILISQRLISSQDPVKGNGYLFILHPGATNSVLAGIKTIYDIPSGLTQYEQDAIAGSKDELKASIQKGADFVHGVTA